MTTIDYTALSAEIRAEIERRANSDDRLAEDYRSLLSNWDVWGNIDFLKVAALNAYGWGAMSKHLADARRDLDAANTARAQAERERDALLQAARDVIAWDDKSSGNYKGVWEIVADADKLNALNALLYPANAGTEGAG